MQAIKQLTTLFKSNPFFRVAVIFGSLFLLLVLLLSPKKSVQNSPAPSGAKGGVGSPSPREELVGLGEEKLYQAAEYRRLIGDRLPIRITNFNTSVGINTDIQIYVAEGDGDTTVRFEINGISYLVRNATEEQNPNITAYKESFRKGLEEMKSRGMDPKQFIFIYSDIPYIRETANLWIKNFSLL